MLGEGGPRGHLDHSQRQDTGALVPVTPNTLVATITGKGRPGMFARWMEEDPRVVDRALNLAYARPELFDKSTQRVRPELSEIRENFPGIIGVFTNDRVAEALRESPAMTARLGQEKDIMEAALTPEERVGIHDVELVLRMLMEDGNAANLGESTPSQVISSHEGYIGLLETLEQSEERLDRDEEKRFIAIGQELGRNRRALEITDEVLDKDPEAHELPHGEKDYRGRVAQLRAMGGILAQLSEAGAGKEVVRGLIEKCTDYAIRLGARYPEKAVELKGIVNLTGLDRGSAYVVPPGAAELNQAELTDTLHGGTSS